MQKKKIPAVERGFEITESMPTDDGLSDKSGLEGQVPNLVWCHIVLGVRVEVTNSFREIVQPVRLLYDVALSKHYTAKQRESFFVIRKWANNRKTAR